MVSPAERGVDGGVGGHEEEEGQEAGGEQPRPVHVVQDVRRLQPQRRHAEVQLLAGHVVLPIQPSSLAFGEFII